MKDVFEKFVGDHRRELDDRNPSPKIWDRISATLFNTGNISLWNSVAAWRAAATVLIALSAYLFFRQPYAEPEKSGDFSDIETYYSAQILEKAALISNEGLFADESFTQDLQKLEAMYTMLAEEMKKHPSPKVKDALVLNMLVRIDLLNQQIQKLEDSKRKSMTSAI